MVDKRRLIGNEVEGAELPPRRRYRYLDQQAVERLRRRGLPQPTDNPVFNQIAYSVLLIAVMGAIGAGTAFINWAFLVYGIVCVVFHIKSNQIFTAALISLVIIPVSTIFQRGTLANIFSVMAFYFLVIGLIRASLELRHQA